MKLLQKPTYILLSTLLVIATLLASCYWHPQNGTGSITLQLQGSTARAVTLPGNPDVARVYIYGDNGNTLIKLKASENASQYADYAEGAFNADEESGTVSAYGVSVGPEYTLVLVLGKYEKATGIFQPSSYAVSAPFVVTANVKNEVQVSMPRAAGLGTTAYDLVGTNLTGLAVANGYWAASTNSALFVATSPGLSLGDSSDYEETTPGDTINSLSAASPNPGVVQEQIWINTSGGVKTYDPSTRSSSLPSQLSSMPIKNILQSGSYGATVNDKSGVVVYYQYDGGLGGTVFTSDSIPTLWSDIPISGISGQAVLDFALPTTTTDFGYFATKLGAFAIGSDLINPNPAEQHDYNVDYVLNKAGFFSVTGPQGNNLLVYSLALDNSDVTILIGTSNGVYETATSSIEGNIDSTTTYEIKGTDTPPLAGTEGHSFTKVLVGPGGSYATYYWVGWASNADYSSNTFYYGTVNGSTVTSLGSIPAVAVSLGTPQAASLLYSNGNVYLAVASSEGLSFVPIGTTQLLLE